jgi:hypothetical protein
MLGSARSTELGLLEVSETATNLRLPTYIVFSEIKNEASLYPYTKMIKSASHGPPGRIRWLSCLGTHTVECVLLLHYE